MVRKNPIVVVEAKVKTRETNVKLELQLWKEDICVECVGFCLDTFHTIKDIFNCKGIVVDGVVKTLQCGLPNVKRICELENLIISFELTYDGEKMVKLIPHIERKKTFVFR